MKKNKSIRLHWLQHWRIFRCVLLSVVAVLCNVIAWASDGISPISPTFLRWKKTICQKQNTNASLAITNSYKNLMKNMSAPSPSEQMEDSGLIPTVFNAAYLGNINRLRVRGLDSKFPSKYDMRSEGFVSSVKNQFQYGTCWAHATYASLESALMKKSTEREYDFSENNLVNLHGGDWKFDMGGNGDLSSAYLLRWSGPVLESTDPYPNIEGSSIISAFRHVQNIRWILPKKLYLDNDGIKEALMKYGGLYVSYYHDAGWYNAETASYYFNIIQKEDDGSRANNHAVTIVGWDDNYSKENFKIKPPANGAYIVKNSMGATWGDDGFFYVSYFDESFAWNRLYAFSNAEPVSNYDAVYQYDTLGLVNSVGWGEMPTWGSCMFTATNTSPIVAVGFYALVPDTSYTIQVYNGCESGKPVSGTKVLEQVGQTDGAGYVTIPLYDTVKISENQLFSIVLKLTTPEYGAPLACEYAVPGYSSSATAMPGQSFVSLDGREWRDFTKLNGTASFCCKAYTRPITIQSKTLMSLVIDGVVSVRSGKSAKFTCRAQYSDGTVKDVTESVRWSIIEGGEYASVSDNGIVMAKEIRDRQVVRLYAEYIDGGVMQSDVWPFYVTYAAPLAPTGVSATQGSETTCIRLCWNETEDTASYAIYRGETEQCENAEYIADATANVFDDTRAVPGVMYHYFIKAKNSSGSSPFSEGVMGWRALSAPDNVVAGNGTSLDYVEVTWCESAGASYYQVYRANDLGDEPKPISAWQSALSIRDKDAVAGVTYLYYVVAAVDAEGGMSSGLSLFDDGRRAVPVFLKSLAINGEVSIASGDSSTYTCTATYTDGSFKLITQPSAWTIISGTAYASVVPSSGCVSTAPVSANQTVVLRADYVEKNVQVTDMKTITIRASKPSAPLAVSTMSVSEQGISISWSVDMASAPALAYRIYRKAADGEQILLATMGADATAYLDRTATPGVTYTYRVSAVNGAGEGPVSAASATETVPLAAPSSVVASDGDYFDKVTVSWKSVTGATQYKVFRGRSQSSASAVEISEWQDGTYFEDVTAEPSLTYWYFVRAAADGQGKNAGGFGSGDDGWRREVPVLDSISVSGAPKLAAGGSAVYSCVATYLGGEKQPVKPQWTVSGPAAIDASGRLQVNPVSSGSTVTLTAQYGEGTVEKTATVSVAIIVPVKARADVKNVTVLPRWPFNGMVDVDYEIETTPEGTRAAVSVSGYDYDHKLALAAVSLAGDGASGAVLPGKHRLSWNVAADHPRLHVRSFGVEMSAVPIPVLIPTNVMASAGTSTDGVNLSWSAVDEALSYEIYRSATDSTNDSERIAATYELKYSDVAAVAGTTYHYWVRTVSSEGLSEFGNSVVGWRAYPDVGVIFDGNGGTAAVWSKEYEPQKVYGELPTATRKGYAFEGWYTSAEGGSEVTAASIVPTLQVTLYAHWKANAYAVRFNANGGKGNMGDLSMTYDVLGELPTCMFNRSGYTFAGWGFSGNGAVAYLDGTSVKNLTEVNGATVSLFAIWSPIVPSAPGNVSATDRTTTDGIVVSWGSVGGATEYRVYRAEMNSVADAVLVGSTSDTTWLDSDCGVGKTYYYWIKAYRADNNQEGGFGATAWGRRRYAEIVCTFNGNGGTATSAAKQYTPEFAYGDLPSGTRTGYTLAGWFTEPVNGSEVTTASVVPASALTLYAHWTPNAYVVHFDANAGNGNMNDQPMTYDRETKLFANKFSRDAYTFAGWATRADGDKVYDDEAPVVNLVSENEGKITLFALWSPILPATPVNVRAANRESTDGIVVTWSAVPNATEYYLFRDENASCQNPQQVGTTTETSYFDTACVAGKSYFYWIKAYRADNGAASASFSSPASEGHRRYSDVTVSFNGNGGTSEKQSGSATPEFAYGTLPAAMRTGYVFEGWYTAATDGMLIEEGAIVPASDTTLYAHWTANSYVIRYDANSGVGEMSDMNFLYDEEKPLTGNTFTRTYYVFVGWATSANGEAVYADKSKVKNLAADTGAVVILYAVWSPIVPQPPTNVQASLGTSTSEIALSWSAAANSTEYEIWRGEDDTVASAVKLGTATDDSYVDETAEAGKVYYYWIKSANPAATGVASVCVKGALKPKAPENVEATCAIYTDKVVVSWSEVNGATRYDVYRSDNDSSATAKRIGQTAETSFTDVDVKSDEKHWYWIKAFSDVVGAESDFSPSAEGYALRKLVSLAVDGASELDAGSDASYTAIAMYSDGTSGRITPLWSISQGSDIASVDSNGKLSVLTSQVDREVGVFASYNDNGHAEVTKTITVHKVIPLVIALDNDVLTFTTEGDATWTWVEDAMFVNSYAAQSGRIADGQSSKLQTIVECPCVVSFRWKASSEAGDKLTFSIDGIAKEQVSGTDSDDFAEQSYTVEMHGTHMLSWIYAKNDSGAGGSDCGWVDEIKYQRIYAPATPTGVSATYGTSTDEVMISWTSVPGATSYEIWRGSSSDVSLAKKQGETTTTSYSDTTAMPGVAYSYWVVAVNLDGASGKSSVVAGMRKLATPTGLTSSADTLGATISWSGVDGATEYKIFRSVSGDLTTAKLIGTTASTSFTDELNQSGEKSGKDYYYWIVAEGKDCSSGYSVAINGYRKLSGSPAITYAVSWSTGTAVACTAVTDAVSYKLYCSGSCQATSSDGNFWVVWMQWGSYWVEVCAVGENGSEGPRTGWLTQNQTGR